MPNITIDITKGADHNYHNELHKLLFSPNIVKIKAKNMSWVEHVARMEAMHPTFCSKNPKEDISVRAGLGASC